MFSIFVSEKKIINMKMSGIKKCLATFTTLALLFLLPIVSCEKVDPDNTEPSNQENTEENQGEPEDKTDTGKILIVYYSYTGHCNEIVNSLSSNLKADVLRIKEVDEKADYNANGYKLGSDMISAINKAPNQTSSYPAIKDVDKKAEEYGTIFIVTPLWHSHMAAIMQTYLFQNRDKMKGKNIGLVVSSASSGISGVESDAKRLVPDGKFYDTSLWLNHSNHSKRADLVKEWLKKNKIN